MEFYTCSIQLFSRLKILAKHNTAVYIIKLAVVLSLSYTVTHNTYNGWVCFMGCWWYWSIWVNFLVETIYSWSDKFATGVKIKATGRSSLNINSPAKILFTWLNVVKMVCLSHEHWQSWSEPKNLLVGGAGMAQWWERSPPTNVAQVFNSSPVSYECWVCCWFSLCCEGFSPGSLVFLPLQKLTLQIPIRPG